MTAWPLLRSICRGLIRWWSKAVLPWLRKPRAVALLRAPVALRDRLPLDSESWAMGVVVETKDEPAPFDAWEAAT